MSPSPARIPAGVLQVSAAGVLWGTAPVALAAVDGLSPLAVSAVRTAVGAAVLVLAATVARSLRDTVAAARDHPALIVLIGLGVACYQSAWFVAIPLAGAAVSTVLALGTAPVLTAGWDAWRARRLPSPRRVLVLGAGLAGLVLVSAGAGGNGSAPVTGLLLAAVSGLAYAAVTVLSHRAAARTAPTALATATTAVGALGLLPVALLTGLSAAPGPLSLAALGYLGVVTTAGAFLLLHTGLRTASPGTATIATLLEPATAAVLAVVLLGESLPAGAVAGIALVLGAVAFLREPAPSAAGG